MKRLIIAAIALMGFSAASFAQATPAVKKDAASKMQVVKKTDGKGSEAKVAAMNKVTKTAPTAAANNPAVQKQNASGAAASAKKETVVKTNAAAPLKKDGTPDMRYKANQGIAKGPLKKDGTADMRFKANKKHS